IMLASILERIKEIGVRRAVGATQKDVLAQFLSEAVMISLAGGLAGILTGAILSSIIEHAAKIHTIVSPLSVVVAFGVSVAVGPLTLANAVDLAQRQGLSAKASRDALAEARARNDAFNARLRPQVSLSGQAANYNHAIVPITQENGSTAFRPQSQNQSSMGLV